MYASVIIDTIFGE